MSFLSKTNSLLTLPPCREAALFNQALDRTTAPLGRDEVTENWAGTGFGGRRGRAAVAHLGRYAEQA